MHHENGYVWSLTWLTLLFAKPRSSASAALRFRRFAALLGRSLCGPILARATRRALHELPEDLLADIGVARSDMLFVARALVSGHGVATRDVPIGPSGPWQTVP